MVPNSRNRSAYICCHLFFVADVCLECDCGAARSLDFGYDLFGLFACARVIDSDLRSRRAPAPSRAPAPIPELAPVTSATWPCNG